MDKLEQNKDEPQRLSERVELYRREVQSLVKQGGEQPQFEFKRMVSLTRETLDDRLDFIKLLQGLSNAEIVGERCLVIGADPKEKKFFPVTNMSEFDAAKLSQILGAYLSPMPHFEVFQLATKAGECFVLISLAAAQPRPILVIKQGHTQSGKTRLEPGEIWIKKNTSLARATRAELDAMYRVGIEEAAEDRARKRVRHLLEITTTQPSYAATGPRVPTLALLAGPKNDLRLFMEELIASADLRRFRMLLELTHEALIEGWDNLTVRGGVSPLDMSEFTSNVSSFFRDQFLTSVQSVVELGLLIIKHEADESWLSAVIELLVEAFEASRGLNGLKSGYVTQQPDSLKWWRPAFEIYIAIRTLSVYAITRKRRLFLSPILPRIVTPISIDDRSASKKPIMFWPFLQLHFQSELDQGRASFFWKERVGSAWGKYFGTLEKFLASSSQLELLLEFNSFVATNAPKDTKLGQWLALNASDTSFTYVPDLYSQDLQTTVPMAELLYDVLLQFDPNFPRHLAISGPMFDQIFGCRQPPQRLEIYAAFLIHVKTWQENTMFHHFRRYPYMYMWEGRLLKIVSEYESKKS